MKRSQWLVWHIRLYDLQKKRYSVRSNLVDGITSALKFLIVF